MKIKFITLALVADTVNLDNNFVIASESRRNHL